MAGKLFEHKTSNHARLLSQGFKHTTIGRGKNDFVLSKTIGNHQISFVTQHGFKTYMRQNNVEVFRCPDEAYIYESKEKTLVKILEKKEQIIEGSVETKLWSGPSLKREYELMLGFDVQYAFCLSDYFYRKFISNDKKYSILQTILKENDIHVLYGDDKHYFSSLDKWLYM